jgi:hypothetical protein
MFSIVHSKSLPILQFIETIEQPKKEQLITLDISDPINIYYSQINLQNQKINILLHIYNRKDKPQEIFNYILHILCFFLEWKPPNCSKNLTIEIYLTNHKKKMPAKNKFQNLTINETNNAFTITCTENTTITIFRKEEWKKVIIHEIFHCYGLDFSANAILVQYSNQQLQKIFRICSTFQLYETFCETNANVFFICYNLCLFAKKILPFNKFDNKMREFIRKR